MGSCCFTPTKRDFLWWYWLFLVSIVGIPMLLAVWYVSQGSNLDEEEKLRRGKTAARIFWLGTIAVGLSTFVIMDAILKAFYFDPSDKSYWGIGYSVFAHRTGWIMLAMQFCIATVAANGANNLIRKRPLYARIPLLLMCIGLYWFTMEFVGLSFARPAIHFMQFLVCMLPAHYWGVFKDEPDTRRAWRAFWSFFAAAGLFFLVSYFGEDFAQLFYGTPEPWWR